MGFAEIFLNSVNKSLALSSDPSVSTITKPSSLSIIIELANPNPTPAKTPSVTLIVSCINSFL